MFERPDYHINFDILFHIEPTQWMKINKNHLEQGVCWSLDRWFDRVGILPETQFIQIFPLWFRGAQRFGLIDIE